METIEKINLRGAIKSLEIGGEPLKLPRPDYVPSVVRNTASSIKADTGANLTVTVSDHTITVTRIY